MYNKPIKIFPPQMRNTISYLNKIENRPMSTFLRNHLTLPTFTELEVNQRADKVSGLLHGECNFKSSSRPRADGLVDRFPRFQSVPYFNQSHSRNSSCSSRALSREAGYCYPIRFTQNI